MQYFNSPTPQHGFNILRKLQELKLTFDEAGSDGRVSYVKASICSGTTDPGEIIEAAARISGPRAKTEFETIIDEGENIHWGRSSDGQLYVIER